MQHDHQGAFFVAFQIGGGMKRVCAGMAIMLQRGENRRGLILGKKRRGDKKTDEKRNEKNAY